MNSTNSGSLVSAEKDSLVEKKMQAVLDESKKLLEQVGLQDNDYEHYFGTTDDYRIIFAALLLHSYKQELINQENRNDLSFLDFFVTKAYARDADWEQALDCAWEAIGVRAVYELATGQSMTAEALLKAVSKAAGKAMGAIGWAVALYDYAECMGYLEEIE